MSDPFALRAAVIEDAPQIVDSWLKSFGAHHKSGRHSIATGLGQQYGTDYTWLIRQIISRVPVVVACVPGDPATILGWACYTDECVFYVYVKKAFRRAGLARALLAGHLGREDVVYASRTHANVQIPNGWKYEWMQNVRALVAR